MLQIEVCFIICPGGGNRIYYYQHSGWAGWHTDTILLGILSHGAGAGAGVIISVIMRPGCRGTPEPMIISDAVTKCPLIRARSQAAGTH